MSAKRVSRVKQPVNSSPLESNDWSCPIDELHASGKSYVTRCVILGVEVDDLFPLNITGSDHLVKLDRILIASLDLFSEAELEDFASRLGTSTPAAVKG